MLCKIKSKQNSLSFFCLAVTNIHPMHVFKTWNLKYCFTALNSISETIEAISNFSQNKVEKNNAALQNLSSITVYELT